MLLTLSTTASPATDLGYLLHKNPGRVHEFELSFGQATVFYPVATAERCTMCLLVDIDPVGMVRNKARPEGTGGVFAQYVNDRPYVASSYLSVALGEIFGTAMGGRSKDRPELVGQALPFEVQLPVLPSHGGEALIRSLFEPLGYALTVERLPLDQQFPEWGPSRYYAVTLKAEQRLQDLLNHLSVLIPVLDDEKHYWVGDDEVEKLLRRGGDWLPSHPARDQIAKRYLKHRKSLARAAIERLAPEVDEEASSETAAEAAPTARPAVGREEKLETTISLNTQRLQRVAETVTSLGARTVLDLGCGEGRLLREMMKLKSLDRIVGLDVSLRALDIAEERLRLDQLSPAARARISLIHGSLMYRDKRMQGFDGATVIEVIEHLDAARLKAFERVLFEQARPKAVVMTTPNVEYNVKFENLPAGQFRHPDHRFEWTRREFESWAGNQAERFGYSLRFDTIGSLDPVVGSPTQMAIFELTGTEA